LILFVANLKNAERSRRRDWKKRSQCVARELIETIARDNLYDAVLDT
jgi:hypothetical protein